MNSQEWVRATNALTALEQCGNALAKGIQDQLAALTMAQAVMERTRLWLRDSEPAPPPSEQELVRCGVCDQPILRQHFAKHVQVDHGTADRPSTAPLRPAQGREGLDWIYNPGPSTQTEPLP